MRVAVYGTGGVGGFFGGKLARSGVDVRFIARGAHLDALRTAGLRVASIHGDFALDQVAATDDPAEIGPVDYVLVTVKSQHTDHVAAALPPLLDDNTAVVSLQNGVGNAEKLAAAVGEARTVGGAAYIFSTIAKPGMIEHTAGPATIVVGEWSRRRSERVEELVRASRAAGFGAEEADDIRSTVWSKFAFICAQAGTTAAVRLPIGDIRTAPASRELFHRIVAEVCAVAASEGVDLPAGLPDRHLAFADQLGADTYSSLYHDITHGRPIELDALLGEVVRRGALADVATGASEAVYAVLQPWEHRNRA